MKNFIPLTFFLTVLFLAAQAFCANYYVSPTGDDSKDGTSAATAWATIARVNAATEIQPGDKVLWKCGGIWRGIVRPHSGEEGNPVIYSSYRVKGQPKDAPKPTFYGSKEASQEKDWVEVSPNIWATRETKPEVLGEVDGKFLEDWSLYVDRAKAEVKSEFTVEDGLRKFTFDVIGGGKGANNVQLWGSAIDAVNFPQTMLLKMKVRASQPVTLPGMRITLSGPPYIGKGTSNAIEVTEDWREVEVIMNVNDAPLPEGRKFTWHWSLGDVPVGTKLEVVLESLNECVVDRSLYLNVDVGNIIFDHGNFTKYHYCGMKKWALEDVKAPGDYYYDAKSCRVFLCWDENPAKTCKSIELALRSTVIDEGGCHDVIYDGLAVAYGAAHGFGGGNTRRLTIRNCDLYFIGGGHQHTAENGRPVRFGNAIEFWGSCDSNLVEGNHIWEVYDAALTNQGSGTEANPSIQKNITYRNNLIEKSEYSFEYWNRGGVTENVVFENNTCVDAGVCWSHSQRPNPNGAHMMFYNNSAETTGVVIRNNKFFNSTEVCLRMDNDWRSGLKMEKNEYAQTEGMPVVRWLVKNYYDAKTFTDWQKDSGMDQGSTCK